MRMERIDSTASQIKSSASKHTSPLHVTDQLNDSRSLTRLQKF